MGTDREETTNHQDRLDDAFARREELGDTWGEKVLVKYYHGEPAEYYAAVPGKSHIREAWPDHFDEPVWMHVNQAGYRLKEPTDSEAISWDIIDWDDAPVSAEWEVSYPA